MGDRVIALVTLGLAGLYFYGISEIQIPSIEDILGPRTFPTMIGVGLVIAAAMLIFKSRAAGRAAGPTPALDEADVADPPRGFPVLTGVVVATGAYFASFEPVGYLLATTAYLVALTMFFNHHNKTAAVLSSVAFSCVSYFAFTELLGVRLPGGLLTF